MCRQNVLRFSFFRCLFLPLPRKTKERWCFPATLPLNRLRRSSDNSFVRTWFVLLSSTVTLLSWICQQRRSRMSSIRDPVSRHRSKISLSRVPSRDLIFPRRSSGMYSALISLQSVTKGSARNELLLSGCEELRTFVRDSRLYCSTKKVACQATRGTPNCHDTDRASPTSLL